MPNGSLDIPSPARSNLEGVFRGYIRNHPITQKQNTTKLDEGVFFIASSGGAETKVATVSGNKPGQLVFLVPATLASGEYSVQVRSRMTNSADIRTGTLDGVLSVP